MGVRRAVEFMGGVHHFRLESGRGVAHQGDVVAEFLCVTSSGFDAGVGEQTDDDHVGNALLLEAEIQVGIGKAAGTPMLLNDDVAVLRRKIGMPFAAPFAACEVVHVLDLALGGAGVIPGFVVALFPATVRYDDHLDVEGADGAVEAAQVIEQADLVGDGFEQGEDLAAFGQEIVVGIDQQVSGPVKRVGCVGLD